MRENFKVRDLRNGDWYFVHKIVYEEYGQCIGAIGIALYNALCYYANRETGRCYPSHKTLSERLNISEVCVRFYLKKLVRENLIRIISGKKTGRSNMYDLLKVKSKRIGSNHVTTPSKHATKGSNLVTINNNKITRIINNKEISIEEFYGNPIK